MSQDEARREAVLELMRRSGVYAPESEQQMHQLVLEMMQFVSPVGDDWDEFEEEED